MMKSGTRRPWHFQAGSLHPKAIDMATREAELRRLPLGTLTIVPGSIRREGRNYQLVDATCAACGQTFTFHADNIRTGKTRRCRCQRYYRKYDDPRAKRLSERYDAMVARCHNPNYKWYPAYGGRGIRVKFKTREDFICWMLEHLPHPTYKGVQIDRVNNDGHYEPGNLRLVTPKQNLRNKQHSKFAAYRGQLVNACDLWHLLKTDYTLFELSPHHTAKLVGRSVPVDEIIRRKPRAKRSASASLSKPDPAIVALYTGAARRDGVRTNCN
jgi:hypothetical protein